jgi:aromatic-amino-acid transaminase
MFQTLPEPKLDAILALMTVFREDPRPEKIDLGVGVYKDAAGRTPVMCAIRKAERRLLEQQDTKTYVGMAGDLAFNDAMRRLVFSDSAEAARLSVAQTPGGSGALRLLFDLVHHAAPTTTVWSSAPTWPNHQAIIREVGLGQRSYRYFDPETRAIDFAAMMEDLRGAKAGDVVLLHGCCHNPTGANLRLDEWEAVTALVIERGLVPFVDLAYQGFGDGLDADAAGLRLMAGQVPEMLVAASCSKNFGVYRDRVGAAFALSATADKANTQGALMALARTNYSMPPDHGAAAVRMVLDDPALRGEWAEELEAMRLRMGGLRRGLADCLGSRSNSDRFSFLADHRGMFSLIGATPEQVKALREKHAIYIIGDSRMNVAGLPEDRLDRVAEAFLAVGL